MRMKQMSRAAASALLALCAASGAALAQMPELPEPAPLPVPVVAPWQAPDPAGPVARYFLLLFDTPLGGVRQIDEVTAAVEQWIGHELHPTDAAAVVSYYGQELLIAQDFTRDRQALAEAVGAAVRGQAHASLPVEEGCPSLLARLPQGEELARHAASFYGVLQVLAETVDSVPGPKGLLVFSKGFGRPRPDEAPEAVPEDNPVLEKYLPEQSLYEPTREALLSRQIHLYPVDLATEYREIFPLAGVMSRLAAETRGRYIYPVTELSRLLEQIAQMAVPASEGLVEQALTSPAPSVPSAAVQTE
jgi:hypothetical protein